MRPVPRDRSSLPAWLMQSTGWGCWEHPAAAPFYCFHTLAFVGYPTIKVWHGRHTKMNDNSYRDAQDNMEAVPCFSGLSSMQ